MTDHASGGPVLPGARYVVGERGRERFNPVAAQEYWAGYRAGQRASGPGLLGLLVVAIVCSFFWLVVGIAIGQAFAATPRSGPQPAPVQSSDVSSTHGAMAPGSTGAPRGTPQVGGVAPRATAARPSGAPSPMTEIGSALVSGTASYVAAGYGPSYLALPVGPGHRVQVCGAGGCVTRISTDAGPSLQRQREGRIADLSLRDWKHVCGLPATRGTCNVTVEDPAP